MRNKWLLAVSLGLNLVLLTGAGSLAWRYRERLVQVYLEWRGKASLVFFGDSLTARGEWALLLGRADVRNSGLPGLGVIHLKDLVEEHVLRFKPERCFVMAGINDLTHMQRKVSDTADDYETLLQNLRKGGVEPVVQLTLYERADPVSKAKVDSLNSRLSAYCEAQRIEVLNPNRWLSDKDGLKAAYARDKTHLNHAGYRQWARALRKWMAGNR